MGRAISSKETNGKAASMVADPFCADIRRMVEQGLLSLTSADILKCKLIELVQRYSTELPLLGEDVSEFFLDVCDLMVSGDLRKMSPHILKVYLVAMAYSDTPQKSLLKDMQTFHELTGITDLPALSSALEHLQQEGYIDSENNLLAGSSKKRARKPERSGSGLLDRFPS